MNKLTGERDIISPQCSYDKGKEAIKNPEGEMVQVKNEIKKACFALEKQIDEYVHKEIGL